MQVALAEYQVDWLDCAYWDLYQVTDWNRPRGRQLSIDQLLIGLQEGRIVATGRRVIDEANGRSKLGDREPISALAWLDLIIVECDYGFDLYVKEWNVREDEGDIGRLAWEGVRIKREDVLAFWAPLDASSTQEPAVRSGLPGRPTSKHLVEQEFERRIKAGEVAPSLQAEATYLKDWLEKNHPDAPSSGLSAIQNNIRERYNEAKCRA